MTPAEHVERDARAIAAAKAAGMPQSLIDLCLVDGVEKVVDWLQVYALAWGRRDE